MSKWTTEIRIVDCMGPYQPVKVIERVEDEDTETLLVLLKCEPGQFEYDGRSAYARKPMFDPIRRRIIFHVELY